MNILLAKILSEKSPKTEKVQFLNGNKKFQGSAAKISGLSELSEIP